MITTVIRIWWYQFVISTLLIASVKPNCISEEDDKYSCGHISVWIKRYYPSYEIIEINCKDHYEEMDYVKWIAKLNYKPTKQIRIQISQCPIPNEAFVKIVSISHIQFIQYFQFEKAIELLNSSMPTFKPYHFVNFSSVETMDLSNNVLEELPEELFTDMVNLEELNLFNNNLRSLPEKIFEPLKKLKTLSISKNQLTSLEEGIFRNLFALKKLSLSINKLYSLTKPVFSSLSNLIQLELTSNSMRILNDGIFDNLKNLKTLSLNGNKLIQVPERPFVSNTNLVMIDLNNAFDKLNFTLPLNFFDNLQSLKELHLRSNNLSVLPQKIFHFNAPNNLEKLDLSNNQLSKLDHDLFRELTKLEMLDLSINQLSKLDHDLFHELRKLEKLDLGHNQLSRLEDDQFHGLENLKTLRINDNGLINIREKFCKPPRPYGLTELDLSNNQITMNTTTDVSPLSDCHSLTKLNLSNNSLMKIYKDWRYSFNDLSRLELQKNKLKNLTEEDFHFPIKTRPTIDYSENEITSIDLTGIWDLSTPLNRTFEIKKNPIICDCNALSLVEYLQSHANRITIKADNVFCNAPESLKGTLVKNVIVKDLKCPLHEIHPEQIDNCPKKCMCSYRSKDKVVEVNCTHRGLLVFPQEIPTTDYDVELLLDGNNLTSIDGINNISENIRNHLINLSLSYNKLKGIKGIEQLKGLKTLKLDNNHLTYLTNEAIEHFNSLGHLTTITLDKNRWKCDCEHGKPLLSFIRHRQLNKMLNQGDIQCTDWPNRTMLTSLTEDDLCNTSFRYLLYAIITTFLLLCCFIALLYCTYKREIKVWMFAHKLFRWIVTEEDVDKDKKYDAFISFSHKDQEFVDKHLIPELEKNNDQKYKLCIHYRDFRVGEYIPEQITYFVENSRRTIIVLTPDFLSSVWGKMEFRTAHSKAIRDNCARVIVIMLRDVRNEILDHELKAYIRMNTYVEWGDKMFWYKLKYSLGRPTAHYRRRRNGSMADIELLNSMKDMSD